MSLIAKLIAFSVRQVIGIVAGQEARQAAGAVAQLVQRQFIDHSQTLPKALARANDRAWQTLSIALAGDSFLDQIKLFFASGDDKGIREQVRLFLQDKTIGFEGSPADFRKQCLVELRRARQLGLLSADMLSPREVAEQAAEFQRYADPTGLQDAAGQVMAEIAHGFEAEFPNLGKLLGQRPAGGPPLLVAAFAYFFRREVETDEELAHGLFLDGLRQLSASQTKAFSEVNKALTTLGDQFEQVFEQLGRIETVVVETHGAVLDIQAELQRLGGTHDEARGLMQEVLRRVSQVGMQSGEVRPQHSFSIRSDDERRAVKKLLAQFRRLPSDEQKHFPALLNGLGKLQIGSGDFAGATATFEAVAQTVSDATAKAEAHYNVYRAALEEKKWYDALAAIQQAAALDAVRFAPFPMQRYVPTKILGAGGFGTAFLCHDRNFEEEVVVKTLHDAAMERNMADVFREARLLRKLNHPAIIGVHECEYADPLKHARPYIVMDYFAGGSLENCIQQSGILAPEDLVVVARQIAEGMRAAHQQDILHRDLTPDNVLVRKDGDSWKVKIIDFGLALRKQAIETGTTPRTAGNTILGDSVAGTLKYAPPEQIGEMKGVKPGPYSDVYSFGKMCCYALFKTTEPRRRQWAEIADNFAEMLEKCIEQSLEHRLPSFEPVLQVLEELDRMQAQRRKEAGETRQKAQLEQERREAEEADRQRKQQENARQERDLQRKRHEQEEADRQRKQREAARQQAELESQRKLREEEESQRKQQELLRRQQEDEAGQMRDQDECAWQAAVKEGTAEGYQRYLSAMPNCRHAALARQNLEAIPDSTAWQEAQNQGTVEAYEQYRMRYPAGQHFAEAGEFVASRLRSMLLKDLLNVELRKRYLAARNEKFEKMDAESLPVSWRFAYICCSLVASLPIATVVGLGGELLGEWLGWRWFYRVPLLALAGFIVGAVLGFILGKFFQHWMVPEKERASEDGVVKLAGAPGCVGGFIAAAIGGWFAGAITGTIVGFLGGTTLGGDSAKKFGPLPFGAHPSDDSNLRKIYLGEK